MSPEYQVQAKVDSHRTSRGGWLLAPVAAALCAVGLAGQALLDETYARAQYRGVSWGVVENGLYFLVALAAALAVLWICATAGRRARTLVRVVLLVTQLASSTVAVLILRMSFQSRHPTRGGSASAILLAEAIIAVAFAAGVIATAVLPLRRRRDASVGGTHPDALGGD